MKILYNDTDITDKTRVRRCDLTQYLYGHLDTLTISFDNSQEQWTGWEPKNGDKINVTENYADSGTMYVVDVRPEGDVMILEASTVKKIHTGHVHSWKNIGFKQMINHLADDNGLTVNYFGVSDQKYSEVIQQGENDYKFINELCKLEGCVFSVNNGAINVISNDYIKSIPVADFYLKTDSGRFYDNDYYTGCEVTDGETIGKAGNDSGESVFLQTSKKLESVGEANRFAANMLTYANRTRKGGNATVGSLVSELMPGSKIKLTCAYWEEQPILITKVRHEIMTERTKIWFCLEDS